MNGFWLYMLLVSLLIPLVMVVVGLRFTKSPPRKINYFLGYRTTRSMKNRDTWDFAHRYFGKLWAIAGLVLLPVSAVPMGLVYHGDINTVSVTATVLCAIQLAALLLSIIPTELALKRTFDQKGKRR